MKSTSLFFSFVLCIGISMSARVSVYDMHKYLAEPLREVFNTSNVDIETLEKFVMKHDLADVMSKFVKTKKKAMKQMPNSFFFGLVYPAVGFLNDYENESAESFINNEKYQKDPKLFLETYPKKACDSSNLTLTLFDLRNMIDWNHWDPMQFYNGVVNAIRNVNPSSASQVAKLEVMK